MRSRGTADDWYRDREGWRAEAAALRGIVLAAGLTETLKWGQPTYTDRDRNIVMVSVRRAAAIVGFFKGALLDDPGGHLAPAGERSRHVRVMVFSSLDGIAARRAYLEALIDEAVEIERAGLRVAPLPDELEYVSELRRRLAADPALRAAFERLTPGRRRAYNLHFTQPVHASTREARITRATARILAGKGLGDCVCGHTEHPPRCDGSHKRFG
ncbi:MAG: YdeI/OmpD-associated family protein [Pseudomonadota bacterium]